MELKLEQAAIGSQIQSEPNDDGQVTRNSELSFWRKLT